MNWKFWKKEEVVEVEPTMLVIPKDKVLEIRRLADAYAAAPAGQDRESFYHLWTAVHEIFPATQHGDWHLTFPGAKAYAVSGRSRSRD